MRSKIYFRADGNKETGLGHLVRSASLALMMDEFEQISFISKEAPETIQRDLRGHGFEFRNITEESEFFDMLTEHSTVVLDGYGFDLGYQKKVKEKKAALICIDDIFDREFVADLIINQAPGVTKEKYQATSTTQFALGPEYALLRPPFLEVASNPPNRVSTKTLFICFGGSDIKNKTVVAIEAALELQEFKQIIVVAGLSYPYLEELKSRVMGEKIIELHHAADEQTMLRLMCESSAAVVPSSGILFEVLAAGCKAISGTYVQNQKQVYSGFKAMNSILDAGRFSHDQIKGALKKLNTFNPPRIIDGKSPERINQLIKQI